MYTSLLLLLHVGAVLYEGWTSLLMLFHVGAVILIFWCTILQETALSNT